MSSSLLTLQNSSPSILFTNPLLKFHQIPISPVLLNLPSLITTPASTISSTSNSHNLKLKYLSRSSPEGIPGELIEEEDSKFVPLNVDDPKYGPPALLLLGFELEETAKIHNLLKEMDGEFLQVIHCTEDMISGSLWEAMNTQPQTNLVKEKIAKSVPRVCFLSGLTGEEMMMFIDALEETELEPAVFAALVPNSADKPLTEVIEEIMGDHEMMKAKEAEST